MIRARHPLAAVRALACGIRYASVLQIAPAERGRYLRKTINCALCYTGFSAHGRPRESWHAGTAAFLSTAFDVLTDWRPADEKAAAVFARVVGDLVPDEETRRGAAALFIAKRDRHFATDGLERGIEAVRLITRVMGCADACERRWGGFTDVGETLQLVDDLLDFDEDVARGDLTSLTSPRAPQYIVEFIRRSDEGQLRRWFGDDRTVLTSVVSRAVRRARRF